MSLTDAEREKVLVRLASRYCPRCGDQLEAWDDGVSRETEWGVPGAYVVCCACGYEAHKP